MRSLLHLFIGVLLHLPFRFFIRQHEAANRKHNARRAQCGDPLTEYKKRKYDRYDGNQIDTDRRADGAELIACGVPRGKAKRGCGDAEKEQVYPVERFCESGRIDGRIEAYKKIIIVFCKRGECAEEYERHHKDKRIKKYAPYDRQFVETQRVDFRDEERIKSPRNGGAEREQIAFRF